MWSQLTDAQQYVGYLLTLNGNTAPQPAWQALTTLTSNTHYKHEESVEDLLNAPEYFPSSPSSACSPRSTIANHLDQLCKTNWFYADCSNQTQGPLALSDLQRLYANKTIRHYTYIFNFSKQDTWFRVCEFQRLHDNLHQYQMSLNQPEMSPSSDSMTPQSQRDLMERIDHEEEQQSAAESKTAYMFDRHIVKFDDSEIKQFQWTLSANDDWQTFYIQFEPLMMKDFEFALALTDQQKRDNFRAFHSNFDDLKLKNKVDSLLNMINAKLAQNECTYSMIDLHSYSNALFQAIKSMFVYHIFENERILVDVGRDAVNMNVLNGLQEDAVMEWKNKLFVAIAFDVYYENVVNAAKYGISYSVNRLNMIAKHKWNYFTMCRFYFTYLMQVPLIEVQATCKEDASIDSNATCGQPIAKQIYQTGHALKGNNFGVSPSWIEIYFDDSRFYVSSTLTATAISECSTRWSMHGGFDEHGQVTHLKEIIDEIKELLERKNLDLRQHKMMELLIKNEQKIMSHKMVQCVLSASVEGNGNGDLEWNAYAEQEVSKDDILYLVHQFVDIKRKFIFLAPLRQRLKMEHVQKRNQETCSTKQKHVQKKSANRVRRKRAKRLRK
eukprot:CAMPEP_0197035510 /NCGR_PEP_ID=MMETSP1384-20130603/13286_1 /TAXON_ID=29189 /ORGANISM="Ammonia sp." /LENGTH=609 /DNA_ID=CAMNT_0042465581 /DNA_START=64 /DNA_END=1893 /DNA_ORIENTATION=-